MTTNKFKGVSGTGGWTGYANHPYDLRNNCPEAVVHIYNVITDEYVISYENGFEFEAK